MTTWQNSIPTPGSAIGGVRVDDTYRCSDHVDTSNYDDVTAEEAAAAKCLYCGRPLDDAHRLYDDMMTAEFIARAGNFDGSIDHYRAVLAKAVALGDTGVQMEIMNYFDEMDIELLEEEETTDEETTVDVLATIGETYNLRSYRVARHYFVVDIDGDTLGTQVVIESGGAYAVSVRVLDLTRDEAVERYDIPRAEAEETVGEILQEQFRKAYRRAVEMGSVINSVSILEHGDRLGIDVEPTIRERNLSSPHISPYITPAGINYPGNGGAYWTSLYFVTSDGGVLSLYTVADTLAEVDYTDATDPQWHIVGAEIHWEGEPLVDDHTGAEIRPVYGDDEEEESYRAEEAISALSTALNVDDNGGAVVLDACGAHVYDNVRVTYDRDTGVARWEGEHVGYVSGAGIGTPLTDEEIRARLD